MNKKIDLIVFAVRENIANCKALETGEKILVRLSEYDLWQMAPGEIATIKLGKTWEFGNNKYMSGRLDSSRIDINALGLVPLKLKQFGHWEPGEELGEYRELIQVCGYYKEIIKAGRRPSYEMDQIVPGDTDLAADGPILEAIYYRDTGDIIKAQNILMDELEADLRCLDAHAHLGNFLFDTRPDRAIIHYKIGTEIGKLSFPKDFNGALLWANIDNRPFFRCMHGYALCLWKLEKFSEAEKIFEKMLWLNPPDNQGARFNLELVKKREPLPEDEDY